MATVAPHVKRLVNAVALPLKEAGYSRAGRTWYLNNLENTVVVNLCRSSFGPNYRIFVGLWLNKLWSKPRPMVSECHIQDELSRTYSERRGAIDEALDLDRATEMSMAWLRGFLGDTACPYLQVLSTEHNLVSEIRSGRLVNAQMLYGVKTHLGLAKERWVIS